MCFLDLVPGEGARLALLDTMRPIVDATVDRLAKTKFCCDPLMGEENSRITSVISSAYKWHGQILETSILECLRRYDKFDVWNDRALQISRAADALAASYMRNPVAALTRTGAFRSTDCFPVCSGLAMATVTSMHRLASG